MQYFTKFWFIYIFVSGFAIYIYLTAEFACFIMASIAQIIMIFHLISICGIHLVLVSALHAGSTEETPCSFPSGSIACKIWNYTNMDCSWRELVCIPPLRHTEYLELLDMSHNKLSELLENSFIGFPNLLNLDLSTNNITTLNGKVFNRLNNLQTLDLSSNKMIYITDDAFISLDKLQTLDLSWNSISTLTNDTFSGMKMLQNLDMSFNSLSFVSDNVFGGLYSLLRLNLRSNNFFSLANTTFDVLSKLKRLDMSVINNFQVIPDSSPFQHLQSLQTLEIQNSIDTVTPTTFVGLNLSLNFLDISVKNMVTDTPFIQLSSLRHLELRIMFCDHINERLFVGLGKLKYLAVSVDFDVSCLNVMNFFPLVSLRNLIHWTSRRYVDLHSLNSSLRTLELQFVYDSSPHFNSSTFESLPKWKESLQELIIRFSLSIDIVDSPFTWFSQLHLLLITSKNIFSIDSMSSFSEKTFIGLKNLKELHLNYLDIDDSAAYSVVSTFSKYNSLKVLDLSHNIIQGHKVLDLICSLSLLEILNLSYNKFFPSPSHLCLLPNLAIIQLESQNPPPTILPGFNLQILCKTSGAPYLTLDVYNTVWNIFYDFECDNVISLNSSKCKLHIPDNSIVIRAPSLEEIYFCGISVNNEALTEIKILNIFKTQQLKRVDLSSNQIAIIDREDAWVLRNVSYLNLRNNVITSLSNLNNLYNLKTLLIGGNKISIFPKFLLSNNHLRTLDVHDNVFICDCRVEDLQRWILGDQVTYLWKNVSKSNVIRYRCAEPDSQQGLSITEVKLDCELPLLMYISVSVTCGLVVIMTTILVVRYRWHIQYKLFVLFNRREYQNYLVNDDDDDYDDEDGIPRYDAYVIYHNGDEDWVDEQLLANIEENEQEPFRLCLKNRDIRAGRLIFNEISLHIRRSRKTLVILTPRFIEDNWCHFQLNMAHHRVLEENHNVLIFIMLEKIADKKLTLLLRQLFCRSQCFRWPNDEYGQGLFWQRLREELKRPVPRDQIHHYRRYNIWMLLLNIRRSRKTYHKHSFTSFCWRQTVLLSVEYGLSKRDERNFDFLIFYHPWRMYYTLLTSYVNSTLRLLFYAFLNERIWSWWSSSTELQGLKPLKNKNHHYCHLSSLALKRRVCWNETLGHCNISLYNNIS